MTKVYDFSVTDMREHNFVFAEMTTTEIEDKKKILEEHQKAKAAAAIPTVNAQENPATSSDTTITTPAPAAKPVFRPKIKPPGSPPPTSNT
jgi:hypothetical protein